MTPIMGAGLDRLAYRFPAGQPF